VVVVVSKATRDMRAAKTPDGWEMTLKRHTLKTPDSKLGCLSVHEELFKNEVAANQETRATITKHLPGEGTARNILVDWHEALQQRVERSEAFIMQMLKTLIWTH
jgi:predicted amidohydrolase YtcJ